MIPNHDQRIRAYYASGDPEQPILFSARVIGWKSNGRPLVLDGVGCIYEADIDSNKGHMNYVGAYYSREDAERICREFSDAVAEAKKRREKLDAEHPGNNFRFPTFRAMPQANIQPGY